MGFNLFATALAGATQHFNGAVILGQVSVRRTLFLELPSNTALEPNLRQVILIAITSKGESHITLDVARAQGTLRQCNRMGPVSKYLRDLVDEHYGCLCCARWNVECGDH